MSLCSLREHMPRKLSINRKHYSSSHFSLPARLGVGHVDDERHIEITVILIGLSLCTRELEKLCHVLPLAIRLRHARFDPPLFALRGRVSALASNDNRIRLCE